VAIACVLHRGEGHGLAPPVVTAVDVVDAVVVGGGIVGLATARRLAEHRPDARILVLEKEASVGRHQSSHNSGVLHAGLYYAPGSRKAELCRRGKAAVEAFAEAHDIPIVRNGKLVVAVGERELPALAALTERAQANGVPELRTLDRDELREIEPHVAGVRALHSPTTAVIDFGLVCDALASELDVRTGTGVVVAARETRGPGDRCADRAVPRDMARVAAVRGRLGARQHLSRSRS
jgi:(S)-2-hydroxyglutarate dehydrogenase